MLDTFICNCGRQFNSRRSLNSYARFCSLYVKVDKTSKYLNNGVYTCECGKCFDYSQSFNAHLSHCDIHHEKVGTERKKRPNEIYKTMCWENKTDNDIKQIHTKAGRTYSKRVRDGIVIPSFRNRKHTEDTKRKIRISTLKYMEQTFGPLSVRYNKSSIAYINSLNEKYNWNLQHAENGGEICIDGYYLDGYDKELNIVFEYDEPRHYIDVENSILVQRDIDRQNYIINKLKCRFFRYNERMDYLYEIKQSTLK